MWTTRILTPKPYSAVEVFKSLGSFRQWHALRLFGLAQLDWPSSRRARRSVAWGSPVPWWSYGCTSFVDQVISPQKSVLDIGSGASTLWWLERGNSVVALETDAKWGEEVSQVARQGGFELELSVGPLSDLLSNLMETHPVSFNVICIDNQGDRVSVVKAALPLMAEGGVIILDNSDRSNQAEAREFLDLNGFRELIFHWLGPINPYAFSTSVFLSSASLEPEGREHPRCIIEY